MAMQFWGVEAKAKEPSKVTLEEGQAIHLSQATLGELKTDNEPVIVHVKVDGKKFVLGVLSQTTPQLPFDLVFEQDFEISHNLKNGSVHFLGYSTELPGEEDDIMFGDDSDEDEDVALPILQKENGKPGASAQVDAAKPKADVKPAKDDKPKQQEKDDSDDSDDVDFSDFSDEDEDMFSPSDDDSDNDSHDDEDEADDDDEDENEKPAEPESGKKRAKADAETPEAKKAKIVTPQKEDGKKGVHTATPHPSKKGAKTPGGGKPSPKSGGQIRCEPCKKSFNSENALQSHKKAKHGAK